MVADRSDTHGIPPPPGSGTPDPSRTRESPRSSRDQPTHFLGQYLHATQSDGGREGSAPRDRDHCHCPVHLQLQHIPEAGLIVMVYGIKGDGIQLIHQTGLRQINQIHKGGITRDPACLGDVMRDDEDGDLISQFQTEFPDLGSGLRIQSRVGSSGSSTSGLFAKARSTPRFLLTHKRRSIQRVGDVILSIPIQ